MTHEWRPHCNYECFITRTCGPYTLRRATILFDCKFISTGLNYFQFVIIESPINKEVTVSNKSFSISLSEALLEYDRISYDPKDSVSINILKKFVKKTKNYKEEDCQKEFLKLFKRAIF